MVFTPSGGCLVSFTGGSAKNYNKSNNYYHLLHISSFSLAESPPCDLETTTSE